MLQGSSNIQEVIANSPVVSPYIKATLIQNNFNAGGQQYTITPGKYSYDAINWKGSNILAQGNSAFYGWILSDMGYGATLGQTILDISFFINGSTLEAWYVNAANQVVRVSDGGGSTNIAFAGATVIVTLAATPWAIAAVQDRVFVMVEPGASNGNAIKRMRIDTCYKSGANWLYEINNNKIFYNRILGSSNSILRDTKLLNAYQYDNDTAFIMYMNRDGMTLGSVDARPRISYYLTDGTNNFTETELIPPVAYSDLFMSNLSKGMTLWYLSLGLRQGSNPTTTNQAGASGIRAPGGLFANFQEQAPLQVAVMVLQSNDLLNWSVPVHVGASFNFGESAPVLSAGRTNNTDKLYGIIGKVGGFNDTNVYYTRQGASIDISNNIINYSNNNNQRITLTLGNFN